MVFGVMATARGAGGGGWQDVRMVVVAVMVPRRRLASRTRLIVWHTEPQISLPGWEAGGRPGRRTRHSINPAPYYHIHV